MNKLNRFIRKRKMEIIDFCDTGSTKLLFSEPEVRYVTISMENFYRAQEFLRRKIR